MAIILVPAPPKSAFNKNRPVSDLLRGQLRHFHHLEATLPPAQRSNMSARELTTENGAAKYIAHLTGVLMASRKLPALTPIRRSGRSARGLDIAAAAQNATEAAQTTTGATEVPAPKTKKSRRPRQSSKAPKPRGGKKKP